MKQTLLKICGGAALAVLTIGLLLAVVLAAKPIEDISLGDVRIENIRSVQMQRPGGKTTYLKREQAQELAKLMNDLEVGRDRSVQKCGTQCVTTCGQNCLKFLSWSGEEQEVTFAGGTLEMRRDDASFCYALTNQSAYKWKKFWNDLWGDGFYDEELLCV